MSPTGDNTTMGAIVAMDGELKWPSSIIENGEAGETAASAAMAASTTSPVPFAARKTIKSMNYSNIMTLFMLLLFGCLLATGVDGLKCHMCGQYNEGVGSITPCLNYSDQYAHLYLKECSKKTEKFCVKYVSELSIVRDCATECAEKEIWETQTYCCNHDGCNGTSRLQMPDMFILLLPLCFFIGKRVLHTLHVRR